jgi:hypothetical protein
MQASIDRVIRSVISKYSVSAPQLASDAPALVEHDEVTALATRLLGNYRDQLARRSLQAD